MSTFEVPHENDKKRGLKGWHVFLIFLGFFSLMFTVNGIFLYHAITSFPGEDVKKSYVQGLDYNRTLNTRQTQRELGWRASAGYENGELIFHLRDQEGKALSRHMVDADIRHAATTRKDMLIRLSPTADGNYAARLPSIEPGQWNVRFLVRSASDEEIVFEAHKALNIKP